MQFSALTVRHIMWLQNSGSNRALQRETHAGMNLSCVFNAQAALLCLAVTAWFPQITAFLPWPMHNTGVAKGPVRPEQDPEYTKGRLV